MCYFCGSGFFVFLMLLAVVVCWMVLHGTILVGRLFYVGQRGFEFCWLTYVRVICFHQKGMIASIKIRHPRLFAARIALEPWYLYVFALFFK